MERLDEAGPKGASGSDVGGLRANPANPLLHGRGERSRPVLSEHARARRAGGTGPHVDYVDRLQPAINADRDGQQ